MAAKFSGKKHFNADVDQIVSIVKDTSFAQALNLKIKSENPNGDGFWFRFHHGVSFASWGEKITLTVIPAEFNTVKITVESKCAVPMQILDFGQNVQNVRKIFGHIESQVPVNAQGKFTTASEPSNPTSEIKMCTNCGNKIPGGDKFCSGCGAKQNQ